MKRDDRDGQAFVRKEADKNGGRRQPQRRSFGIKPVLDKLARIAWTQARKNRPNVLDHGGSTSSATVNCKFGFEAIPSHSLERRKSQAGRLHARRLSATPRRTFGTRTRRGHVRNTSVLFVQKLILP
jgi:hypothetical protein